MSLVLKAVYRIANKSEVCFIQGKQIGNDLTKGFVFNDIEKQMRVIYNRTQKLF